MYKNAVSINIITFQDAHTLDFASLNTTANITTVRIIDPENPALHNAVRDWEVGELNENKHIEMPPTKVRVSCIPNNFL